MYYISMFTLHYKIIKAYTQITVHRLLLLGLEISYGLTVSTLIDLFRQFRNADFESVLDRFQCLLVFICADERNSQTFGAKTSGSGDTMKILIRRFFISSRVIVGKVIVNDNIHTADIHSSTEQVGRNKDTSLSLNKLFEPFVTNRL